MAGYAAQGVCLRMLSGAPSWPRQWLLQAQNAVLLRQGSLVSVAGPGCGGVLGHLLTVRPPEWGCPSGQNPCCASRGPPCLQDPCHASASHLKAFSHHEGLSCSAYNRSRRESVPCTKQAGSCTLHATASQCNQHAGLERQCWFGMSKSCSHHGIKAHQLTTYGCSHACLTQHVILNSTLI